MDFCPSSPLINCAVHKKASFHTGTDNLDNLDLVLFYKVAAKEEAFKTSSKPIFQPKQKNIKLTII